MPRFLSAWISSASLTKQSRNRRRSERVRVVPQVRDLTGWLFQSRIDAISLFGPGMNCMLPWMWPSARSFGKSNGAFLLHSQHSVHSVLSGLVRARPRSSASHLLDNLPKGPAPTQIAGARRACRRGRGYPRRSRGRRSAASPRGRVATPHAYTHLGMRPPAPAGQDDLFK